jgi:hypothetical protein
MIPGENPVARAFKGNGGRGAHLAKAADSDHLNGLG